MDSRGRDCRLKCWFDQVALGGQIHHPNILRPIALEGADICARDPYILCLAELQEACKTTTYREAVWPPRARVSAGGRFPGYSRSSDPEKV